MKYELRLQGQVKGQLLGPLRQRAERLRLRMANGVDGREGNSPLFARPSFDRLQVAGAWTHSCKKGRTDAMGHHADVDRQVDPGGREDSAGTSGWPKEEAPEAQGGF